MNVDKKYHSIIAEYTAMARGAEALSFMARASEMQVKRVEILDEFLVRLADIKRGLQVEADEYGANLVLSLEFLVGAIRSELVMWLLLKREEPESAWDFLISAQESAAAAIRSHEVGGIALRRLATYEAIERFVFPPQTFSSPGFTVKYRECSICGSSYDDCDHIAGIPTMGELRTVIIKEVDSLLEISIVDNPADKRCRVTDFADQGHYRNKMTWRLDLSSSAEEGQFKGYAARYI